MNNNITPGDLATILGIFAGVVAGFIALAKIMLGQASREREADRKERRELSEAIKRMAKSSDKVADATVRSANEAKERNGHLAELITQGTAAAQVMADSGVGTIVAALQKVNTQQVEHQIIAHTDMIEPKEK